MLNLQKNKVLTEAKSSRIVLDDWALTTVHVARYKRNEVKPRVVLFEKGTCLLDFCEQNNIQSAISAGFFSRKTRRLLGETWIDGVRQNTTPFIEPFNKTRGSLSILINGKLEIGARNSLAASPTGSLIQAGPLLVKDHRSLIKSNNDPDGFNTGAHQFDDDITIGRFPRLAIGIDDKYIFCVSCDGRAEGEAGMTLNELADYMIKIGVKSALNLDGGSSATMIQGGALINRPRGGEKNGYKLFKKGRAIHSAIIFE